MDEETLASFKPPEFLYKYRSLQNKKQRRRIIETITNSEIYFPSPTAFNDPFDSKVNIPPISYEEKIKHVKDLSKDADKRKRLKDAGIIGDNGAIDEKKVIKKFPSIEELEKSTQDLINKYRILSLSATCENILLWSHYAHHHTGLCLEFSANELFSSARDAGDLPKKVSYTYDSPKYEILDQSPNFFTREGEEQSMRFVNNIYTKAEDWRYEDEWRIIDFQPRKGYDGALKLFPKESLVGIIFGCKMRPKYKEKFSKCVREHRPTLKLEQAEMTPGKFSLTIKPYEY